ncbi:hypothetical protein BDK51DRAFT_41444 [Blyttiomyces helicus]|uniref:Uncharacterized protein n=1 Tax=Blyttiomyces helicus TaxID=388810 RepID=A0A4P9WB86_9FUNG|nr:hypothetical protein BDK51DRAFT_41444 [Blyttiomyces helicus]|eukprot:RKO88170.1 hypothetical protein BDK51DRAFT_41444 [Blyttiomyces helicus]
MPSPILPRPSSPGLNDSQEAESIPPANRPTPPPIDRTTTGKRRRTEEPAGPSPGKTKPRGGSSSTSVAVPQHRALTVQPTIATSVAPVEQIRGAAFFKSLLELGIASHELGMMNQSELMTAQRALYDLLGKTIDAQSKGAAFGVANANSLNSNVSLPLDVSGKMGLCSMGGEACRRQHPSNSSPPAARSQPAAGVRRTAIVVLGSNGEVGREDVLHGGAEACADGECGAGDGDVREDPGQSAAGRADGGGADRCADGLAEGGAAEERECVSGADGESPGADGPCDGDISERGKGRVDGRGGECDGCTSTTERGGEPRDDLVCYDTPQTLPTRTQLPTHEIPRPKKSSASPLPAVHSSGVPRTSRFRHLLLAARTVLAIAQIAKKSEMKWTTILRVMKAFGELGDGMEGATGKLLYGGDSGRLPATARGQGTQERWAAEVTGYAPTKDHTRSHPVTKSLKMDPAGFHRILPRAPNQRQPPSLKERNLRKSEKSTPLGTGRKLGTNQLETSRDTLLPQIVASRSNAIMTPRPPARGAPLSSRRRVPRAPSALESPSPRGPLRENNKGSQMAVGASLRSRVARVTRLPPLRSHPPPGLLTAPAAEPRLPPSLQDEMGGSVGTGESEGTGEEVDWKPAMEEHSPELGAVTPLAEVGSAETEGGSVISRPLTVDDEGGVIDGENRATHTSPSPPGPPAHHDAASTNILANIAGRALQSEADVPGKSRESTECQERITFDIAELKSPNSDNDQAPPAPANPEALYTPSDIAPLVSDDAKLSSTRESDSIRYPDTTKDTITVILRACDGSRTRLTATRGEGFHSLLEAMNRRVPPCHRLVVHRLENNPVLGENYGSRMVLRARDLYPVDGVTEQFFVGLDRQVVFVSRVS